MITQGLIAVPTSLLLLSGTLAITAVQPAHANGNCVTYWASSGADGSEANPYPVATQTDLEEVGFCMSSHFIQTQNITLSGNWTPLGIAGTRFTGTYNGNGFSIANLNVPSAGAYNVGLFSWIDGGSVSDLTISSGSLAGADQIGAIAGTVTGGALSNISSAASVSGVNYIGGLVGILEGDPGDLVITNSATSGTITASGSNAGGIAGLLQEVKVTKVHSSSTVSATGASYVGGLIGWVWGGEVEDSYATGDVTGLSWVGGFTGRIEPRSGTIPSITRAYSLGDVTTPTSGYNAGGFTGQMFAGSSTQTYSTGNVTSGGFTGGYIGETENGTVINNSYASGAISGNDPGTNGDFVGYLRTGTTLNSSSDKTPLELQTAATFVDWNVVSSWSPTATWVICSTFNDGYPHLAAFYTAADAPCIDAPGAPNAPTASAGDSQATVSVTAGSGGTPATMTVTANPGGSTCTISGTSGSCTFNSLTNGTAYTFTATASNSNSTSSSSATSAAVTPRASGGGGGTPAPVPTPTPAPSASATTTPTPVEVVPQPVITPAGTPVAPGVVLTPSAVAAITVPERVAAPAMSPAQAPRVPAVVGEIVRLSTPGLPPSTRITTSMQVKGKWVTLGTSRTGKKGRTTLPAFVPTEPGVYLIRTKPKGKPAQFVRVVVT